MSTNNAENFIKKYSLPRQCQICGNTQWNGKKIPLEWHHIDGNHYNNDPKNIMILCPNCHAQTDNYCGKNRGKNLKKKCYCSNCGKELYEQNKTGLCGKCYRQLEKENSNRPTKEQLEQDYKELKSYSAIGKKYNVSDKTAKKWIESYNL